MTEKIRSMRYAAESLALLLSELEAPELPEQAKQEAAWSVWECLGVLNREWAHVAREKGLGR